MKHRTIALVGVCVASAALSTTAFAQWQLGGGAHYGQGLSINAHAVIPVANTAGLEHSVRPQITYGFEGLPAASVSYVVSGMPEDSTVARYLGLGAGVSFLTAPMEGALISFHGLVGFEFPITERFGAFTEATITTSALATGISLGAGVRYTFGVSE